MIISFSTPELRRNVYLSIYVVTKANQVKSYSMYRPCPSVPMVYIC